MTMAAASERDELEPSAAPTDYAVGYGKPPRSTRFQKGQSGNPRGRPKGSKSASALLEQALSAPVSINEGGTTRVIEQRMALFKSLVARAIKGDARAAALVIKLMEQVERNPPSYENPPVMVIERRIVRPGDPGTSTARQTRRGEP